MVGLIFIIIIVISFAMMMEGWKNMIHKSFTQGCL